MTGRAPQKNREAQTDLEVLPLDVRNEAEIARVVAAIGERFGRFDILVNNARIFRAHSVLELSGEVGSMYSSFGRPASIDYSASKTGVLGLTRALAADLGPQWIQVNALLPGWFTTDMNAGLPGSARGEEIRRRTPAGRWGEGGDLAGAAVLLASRASDFVSGAEIPVDGRYHVSDRAIHP